MTVAMAIKSKLDQINLANGKFNLKAQLILVLKLSATISNQMQDNSITTYVKTHFIVRKSCSNNSIAYQLDSFVN